MNAEEKEKTSDILTALLEFYSESDVEEWLTSPHSLLNGETARDVMLRGEFDRVWQIIDQMQSGAYV